MNRWGWGFGFVGLRPQDARVLASSLRAVALRADSLANSGSQAASGAWLDERLGAELLRHLDTGASLTAMVLDSRADLAEGHSIAVVSGLAHQALWRAWIPPAPNDVTPLVLMVEVYELEFEVAGASIGARFAYRVVVQRLDDGTAIVSIRSGELVGVGVAAGAAAWVSVDNETSTLGGIAEAEVFGGAWNERSWTVPGDEVSVLISSVLADEVPGARGVVRTAQGVADLVVPEPVEDVAGWGVGFLDWAGVPFVGAGRDIADTTMTVAGYDRPQPDWQLAGLEAQASTTAKVGAVDLAAGASASRALGSNADGDTLTSLQLGADALALVAGAGLAGAVAATITHRDGDGDDDSLDMEILLADDQVTRVHLHLDLDDADERLAAAQLGRLVMDPGRLDEVAALLPAIAAGELETHVLVDSEQSIGGGVNLAALVEFEASFAASHVSMEPDTPMQPFTPGS